MHISRESSKLQICPTNTSLLVVEEIDENKFASRGRNLQVKYFLGVETIFAGGRNFDLRVVNSFRGVILRIFMILVHNPCPKSVKFSPFEPPVIAWPNYMFTEAPRQWTSSSEADPSFKTLSLVDIRRAGDYESSSSPGKGRGFRFPSCVFSFVLR